MHLSIRTGPNSFASPRNGQEHSPWIVIYLLMSRNPIISLILYISLVRSWLWYWHCSSARPNSASIGCIANTIFVRENERNKFFVESVNSGSRRFNMSLDMRIAEILVAIDYVQLFLRIEWQTDTLVKGPVALLTEFWKLRSTYIQCHELMETSLLPSTHVGIRKPRRHANEQLTNSTITFVTLTPHSTLKIWHQS